MPTAQMSASTCYRTRVQGRDLSHEDVDAVVAHNIKSGLAYGLVTEGLLELKVLGREVVPVLSGSIPGLSLSALFGTPKVTIRCGACARSSKSELVPLTINGVVQQSSLIYCDHCGTANIANVYPV